MSTILNKEEFDRVILFASSKQKVKEIFSLLRGKGFNVGEMHSDLLQTDREIIMREFKNRHINILIATDIVSRGIDIDDIQLVINYDVPRDPEDYVHRIGRTARANRDGQAISLVSPKDYMYLQKIERLIKNEIEKPELPMGCGTKPEITGEQAQKKKRSYRRYGNKHSKSSKSGKSNRH